MPSNQSNLTRPRLQLDEQSFQGLLSAAFTIQEHNERRRQEYALAHPETVPEIKLNTHCLHCGAPKSDEESVCDRCGLDKLRPGERMQRNWASMWLMSQEQGLWPEPTSEPALDRTPNLPAESRLDVEQNGAPAPRFSRAESEETFSASNFLAAPKAGHPSEQQTIVPPQTIRSAQEPTAGPESRGDAGAQEREKEKRKAQPTAMDHLAVNFAEEGWLQKELALAYPPTIDLDREAPSFNPSTEITLRTTAPETIESLPPSADDTAEPLVEIATPKVLDWTSVQASLRSIVSLHRADLYLGAAIFVAVLALLWPVSAPKRPTLGLWDRTLISLGIAEAAPTPVAHLPGDPGVQVWIDPHTALYYCPGDDLYGKAANGRFSTQREAQMDRFEPASRSACE